MAKSKTIAPQSYGSLIRDALDEAGNSRDVTVSIDLEGHGEEVIDALRQITKQSSPVSSYRLRIASRVAGSDAGAVLLNSLVSASPATRRAAAQACGLLRFEAAVPALSTLLIDPERRVRRAAAEALGRIGGQRAADHLLRALRSRSLAMTWLLLALVRAAPDHYLETRLAGKPDPRVLPWLALAVGIHGRKAMRPNLVGLFAATDMRTRANACRALGWIGEPSDALPLRAMLHDEQDKRVREAAARALRRFRDPAAAVVLESLAPAHVRPTRHAAAAPIAPAPVAAAPAAATFRPAEEVLPAAEVAAVPGYRPGIVPPAPAPIPPAPQPLAAGSGPTPPVVAAVVSSSDHRPARPPLVSLLRAIHGAMSRPSRKRDKGVPPLTPLEVATTPHHYTPSPALLEADDGMAAQA